MLTLSLLIPSAIATVFGVSLAVGLLTSTRTREEKDADATWRNIIHRNTITEPIPFASSVARVNDPGLVQVHPRRDRPSEPEPTSIPTYPYPLDQAAAPTPTPTADVQPACPAPVSIAPPAEAAASSASAAPKLPMKLAEEPCRRRTRGGYAAMGIRPQHDRDHPLRLGL